VLHELWNSQTDVVDWLRSKGRFSVPVAKKGPVYVVGDDWTPQMPPSSQVFVYGVRPTPTAPCAGRCGAVNGHECGDCAAGQRCESNTCFPTGVTCRCGEHDLLADG
jgi:hypothetical protein